MSTAEFWKGDFGDEYHRRQGNVGSITSNVMFFSKILDKVNGVDSVIEFGSGDGRNMRALSLLQPNLKVSGVEINEEAARQSGSKNMSMLDYIVVGNRYDLSFTKGVLIHIHPDDLPAAYDVLYASSNKYILVAEYYSPTPVEVDYRGHSGKLWKRDFAGEMMDRYPLELLDYGFVYRRDNAPQDDLTWFLMGKLR